MKVLHKLKREQAALIKRAERLVIDGELPMVATVIKRLIELLPEIQKLHPDITGFWFGMGRGGFKGVAHVLVFEVGEVTEPYDVDGVDLIDYLKDPKSYSYKAEVNDAMYEAAALIDYFVFYEDDNLNLFQSDGLNASTMIDEIRNGVVIFERDEVVTSPFGHEPKGATESSKFFKLLRMLGIPTKFEPQR
jgi:hypothetical protein